MFAENYELGACIEHLFTKDTVYSWRTYPVPAEGFENANSTLCFMRSASVIGPVSWTGGSSFERLNSLQILLL